MDRLPEPTFDLRRWLAGAVDSGDILMAGSGLGLLSIFKVATFDFRYFFGRAIVDSSLNLGHSRDRKAFCPVIFFARF